MTLMDPREALAEQSNFIGYLMGLASLGRVVQAMAEDSDRQTSTSCDADEFVHVLLGVASLGSTIEGLAETAPGTAHPEAAPLQSDVATTRWLR